jgi:hypothetical protein
MTVSASKELVLLNPEQVRLRRINPGHPIEQGSRNVPPVLHSQSAMLIICMIVQAYKEKE